MERTLRLRSVVLAGVGLVVVALVVWWALVRPANSGQAGAATAAYSPPRTADGKPDLNGIWQALNTAEWDVQDHSAKLGIPAGLGVVEGGEIPYQAAALARREENFAKRATEDPVNKCFLPGVPRATYMSFPFEITQTADVVSIAYEYAHGLRLIPLDGRPHLEGALNFYMGDSRGRWDGDTLVVEVKNLSGENWLDRAGNFYSDTARVVERYTRTGPDHLQYEAVIEDPNVFTRAWTIRMPLYRRVEKGAELLEYECFVYETEERYKHLK
jgi:hypothetical protein